MLRALLLDLDGTLVDTPQAIVDVAQSTLAALGLPSADPQAIKDTSTSRRGFRRCSIPACAKASKN